MEKDLEEQSPGTIVDTMFKDAIETAYKRGFADGAKSAVDKINESIKAKQQN